MNPNFPDYFKPYIRPSYKKYNLPSNFFYRAFDQWDRGILSATHYNYFVKIPIDIAEETVKNIRISLYGRFKYQNQFNEFVLHDGDAREMRQLGEYDPVGALDFFHLGVVQQETKSFIVQPPFCVADRQFTITHIPCTTVLILTCITIHITVIIIDIF